MKNAEMNILANEYSEYLRVIRRLSSHTVAAYSGDLARFTAFVESEGLTFPPDRRGARAFAASLNRQGLQSRSVNRNLAAVRGFFRYLIKRKLVEEDPFGELENLKESRRIPVFLRENEINAMLDHSRDDFAGQRDRLILELLYSTGCRVSEACGIKLEDIEVRKGRIRVMGKGSKERFTYLGDAAKTALTEYLAVRTGLLNRLGLADSEQQLFINSRGSGLSDRSVRDIVKKAGVKAGVGKQVSPHTLRHSFATHLVEGGAGIRSVQELLGHSSLRATQVYTHAELDRLRRVHAGAHPHGTQPGCTKNDKEEDKND